MKLIYSPNSPYARKTRIAWREAELSGVDEHLDSPIADDTRVPEVNPLGKVPALILDTGEVLIESALISAYFAEVSARGDLVPDEPGARRLADQTAALADGIVDAAVATVFETRRPDASASEYWLGRWRQGIGRTLDRLETRLPAPAPLSLSTITVGCALAYLDFRLPDLAWREGHPGLAVQLEALEARESFRLTAPPTPA